MVGVAKVWTDEKKANVRRMWCDERMSASEIGAAFGVTRNTICGVVNRMGLDNFRGASPEEVEIIRERRRLSNLHRIKVHGERERQRHAVKRLKQDSGAFEFAKPKPSDPPPGGFTCVAIADRRKDQCAWVVGEPADGMQCGQEAISGKSWCAHHQAIVFAPRIAA